jgi:hypothetical protein
MFYPDLLKAGVTTELAAYKHWIYAGKKEGRLCKIEMDNNENFNWEFYLATNSDLKTHGIVTKEQLYLHWIKQGQKENRISSANGYLKIYNSIINIPLKDKTYTSDLIIETIDKQKNDNYVILTHLKEKIKCGDPYFKPMNMITPGKISEYGPFIFILDFDVRGGGASHFLNIILQLYKSKQNFLIARRFRDTMHFYINDDIMIDQKCNTSEAIKFITTHKKSIRKIFINSIVSHDPLFINHLFELEKKITTITHDYSLIFDKWYGYYFELYNKSFNSSFDINKIDKLITQNKNNLSIYGRFLNKTIPSVVSELPDHKNSLQKIESTNEKTVVGILGEISDLKGFYLVYKLIETFKDHKNIEIIVFGKINMEYNNVYNYSNVDELNILLEKHKPNIWIETSLWPETYSYTLTLMMLTKLPILYQKKTFPSVVEDRLSGYKNKYEFERIDFILTNPNLITDRKQNYLYTIDNRIYSNSYWDSYFQHKEVKRLIPPEIINKPLKTEICKTTCLKYNISLYCVYFPQFHSFAENDKSFYKGFTDIKNLEYLKDGSNNIPLLTPSYKEFGLKRPSDYDLIENRGIIQKQIDLLEKYNMSGFAMYYYWFSTNTITKKNMIMEKVIDGFFSDGINAKGRKIFFIWANEDWTRNPAFGKTEDRIENYYDLYNVNKNADNLMRYFKHPNYLKIDNKPVFFLHHPWFLSKYEIDTFKRRLNEKCIESGFDGVHFRLNSMNKTYSDYLHYDFHFNYKTDKSGAVKSDSSGNRILDYGKYIDSIDYSNKNIKTLVFDFDNRIRLAKPDKLKLATICKDNTPENQQMLINKTIESYKNTVEEIDKIMLINSWNEWGEKMAIEPSCEWWDYYLNIIKTNFTK